MSIQAKFGVLLTLFGLTVVVSLGMALWSVTLLQRELAEPLAGSAAALDSLGRLKRNVDARLLLTERAPRPIDSDRSSEGSPPATEAARMGASSPDLADEARRILKDLRRDRGQIARVGVNAMRTLERRLHAATNLVETSDENDVSDRREAARALRETRHLIERIETRVLEDAELAVDHGQSIRSRLVMILGLTFASAALIWALGMILIRRWLIRPIRALRTAAQRISAGDFEHRIPVEGRDELAQLSAEVNHMAGTIVKMQEERVERERLAATGEMIRRLAHNIRNPLAGIRGLAEVARADLDHDPELRQSQERIISTVDRFEQWLADLLYSTSPMTLRAERRDVRPWLKSVVDAHRAMAGTFDVTLEFDADRAPTEAVFDPRHLEQALVAILTNAIEATPGGGRVRIKAKLHDPERRWETRIEDDGPGVPPDLAKRIFSANFTTKPGGHGIGLAAAQQVVRSHGGELFVEQSSENRRGAVFVVRLPIQPPDLTPEDAANNHHAGVADGQNSHHRG